eukprot:3703842-Rhodomonas_salina.3
MRSAVGGWVAGVLGEDSGGDWPRERQPPHALRHRHRLVPPPPSSRVRVLVSFLSFRFSPSGSNHARGLGRNLL